MVATIEKLELPSGCRRTDGTGESGFDGSLVSDMSTYPPRIPSHHHE